MDILRTRTAQYLRTLPIWSSFLIWVAVILSPTAYVVAVVCLSRLSIPAPPAWIVLVLFCLMPVAALMSCLTVAWLSRAGRGWRVAWLALTGFAMLLQIGVLFIAIVSAITAAISLP